MVSTAAIRAGKAFVEMGLENSPLRKGLKQSEKLITSFAGFAAKVGGGLIAGGSAILAPITAVVFEFASVGDNLDKMAERTKVSTEALSEYGFATEQTGSSQAIFEKGIVRMQKNLFDAQAGTKKSVDALAQLGFTYDDLKNKTPEEQLEILGDAIGKIENQTIKAGVANDIFGRSGIRLLPLFNLQKKGMQELRQEARDLGLSVSKEQAKDAADFTDAWNRIKRSVKASIFLLGSGLAPTMIELSSNVLEYVKVAREWISENKSIIKLALATGVGMVALGGIFTLIAGAALAAAIGVKVLSIGIGVLGSVLTFLLSPMGLVIATLAAIVHFSGAGGRALEWLQGRFGDLGAFAKETFGLIKKALDANEFKLAAEVLWAALKVAWFKGTEGLSVALNEWVSFFGDVWNKAIDNAARFFINSWAKLQEAWSHVTQFFGDVWSLAMTGMMNSYLELQRFIIHKKIDIQFGDDPENQAKKRVAKIAANVALDFGKNQIKADQNKDISDREGKAKANLEKIINQQVGANEIIDDEAKKRDKAREERLIKAREAAGKNTIKALDELKALTKRVQELPQPEKTALVQNANKNANFGDSVTAQKALGTSSKGGDLRTQAGLESFISLVNRDGQNKTLEEIGKDQIGLLAGVIEQLEKNHIEAAEA